MAGRPPTASTLQKTPTPRTCTACPICLQAARRCLRNSKPLRSIRAFATSEEAEPANSASNKLNIPPNALASLAGGLFGAPSRFSDDILNQVANLPMTDGVSEYRMRAAALQQWKEALQKGTLPLNARVDFPVEPFKSKFMATISKLEMPRFTRRHPKLTDALLREMLTLTEEFELELLEMQAKMKQQPPKQPPKQQQQSSSGSARDEDQEMEEGTSSGTQSSADANGQDQQGGEAEADTDASGEGSQGEGGKEMQLSLEQENGAGSEWSQGGDGSLAEMAAELADKLSEKFEEKMAPIVDSLEAAMGHLGDLEGLLEGQQGWDLSSSVWSKKGWREFKDLRRKLADLRELRDLVRSLGRGGGKGPLRRAPEEVAAPRKPPGVIRTPMVPEEVRGLMRSGNLSLMLPAEAALLAAGWPREHSVDDEEEELVQARGSHPARLLFLARLAEKGLLSYERAGWTEDEPSRVTGRREIRPAAELGPIIVCLDTSGSMAGAREIVAKALVLECMRGAHSQERRCFVYAFSGPGEVQSLELDLSFGALDKLLDFLQCSFSGGTDVDAPFELALARLAEEEWGLADILMVTDGAISPPRPSLIKQIKTLHEEVGLEVHGLLVGPDVTPAMKELCTHLHLFKSWSAVGSSTRSYA